MKPLHKALVFLLLNHVPFTAMRMGLSLYALHLGAAPATVGMMVALYSVVPMLGSVPLGRLMDRRGMRKPLMMAIVLVIASVLITALSTSIHPLFAVTLLIWAMVVIQRFQARRRAAEEALRAVGFEVLEAFGAQYLAVEKDLGLDRDKVNVNGGAIGLGHPLGATGAMILGTALDELERRGLSTALVTLCVGAGMGTATVIERL